jgi:hypothetical protein
MAPPRLTPKHSEILGMAGGLGFGLGLVSPKNGECWSDRECRTRVKTPLLYPHQGYVIRSPELSDLLL